MTHSQIQLTLIIQWTSHVRRYIENNEVCKFLPFESSQCSGGVLFLGEQIRTGTEYNPQLRETFVSDVPGPASWIRPRLWGRNTCGPSGEPFLVWLVVKEGAKFSQWRKPTFGNMDEILDEVEEVRQDKKERNTITKYEQV